MKILLKNRSSAKQRSEFFSQLAIILQSGLPLLRGLELLAQQSSQRQKLLCYKLERSLKRGSSLAEAMGKEQFFFPVLAVRLTAAGEESGELSSILKQLAEYYQRQAVIERFVQQAMLYPALLFGVTLLVLLFFCLYILPVLAEAYTAMGLQPAGSFAVLLACRQLLGQPGWLLCLAVVLAFGSVGFIGRWLWRIFLRSSWSGNFHGLLLEVRFCKLLALLLASGLAITQAVSLITETVEDAAYARQLQLLNSRLQRGVAIETAAGSVKRVFSPLLVELVCVGAATGCLPLLLQQAARSGQLRLEEQLARLKQLLVPCVLLFLALVVGTVVCTVLQPLFSMLATLPE